MRFKKKDGKRLFNKFMSNLAVLMVIPVWVLCYHLLTKFDSFLTFIIVELILVYISSKFNERRG